MQSLRLELGGVFPGHGIHHQPVLHGLVQTCTRSVNPQQTTPPLLATHVALVSGHYFSELSLSTYDFFTFIPSSYLHTCFISSTTQGLSGLSLRHLPGNLSRTLLPLINLRD